MADEKLNTGPGEEKFPEAPAPVTVDEPQAPAPVTADGPPAPAPAQAAVSTPQPAGPAPPGRR